MSDCATCREAGGCSLATSTAPDHYEAHITVAQGDVEAFSADVRSLDMKPIVLDLHLRRGGVMKDMMTSSTVFCAFEEALSYLDAKAAALGALGYAVVRKKLETTPWNARTPSARNGIAAVPPGGYFESHVPVTIAAGDRARLADLAGRLGFHLSRNTFKRTGDREVVMMTARSTSMLYEEFQMHVAQAQGALAAERFETGRVIVEYAIHDTKAAHDAAWTAA